MALDGIVTSAIAKELAKYAGARIYKIYQPSPHDLVFTIRGAGGQVKLLLSANPTYPRIHFTNKTYVNPLEAPMFCMLLRKHCEGGVIEAVTQVGRERVLHIDIKHRDELGDMSAKRLIVEIMGRHSNIILTDAATGIIHDGIHHVTPAISSHRIILPGSSYIAPPEQGKLDPFSITSKEQFDQLWNDASEENAELPAAAEPYKKLVQLYSGISPLLAKEIIYRSAGQASPWDSFYSVMQQAAAGSYEPTIVIEDGTDKSYFSIISLTHVQGASTTYGTISECLEQFYGDRAERDTVKQRAADLIRFVMNERAKNETKINKFKESLEEAKDAEKYRIQGELLTAYMHEIKRGDTSISLLNFYDENQEEITIPLDPGLAPSENAQRYFRKYTKFKNSLAYVHEQMNIASTEITYFEALLQQLDSASIADIEEIREELVAEGYMRERAKRGPKKKKSAKPTLQCYTSSEGISIYVGKNNTQNEYLTNRLAAIHDTWLHTKDIPGSHVVIRETNYGDATLEEAAMLAAHFSQAKGSSLVPVDYTKIRHVRKPNGAKPGFVIYDNQKTIFITPDEERIKALKVETK